MCKEKFEEFYHLYRNTRIYHQKFYEYLRISKESFDLLLYQLLVEPYLTGCGTIFRDGMSAEQSLVIRLR
nr:unnamed protein product [Callosobruchus analis]